MGGASACLAKMFAQGGECCPRIRLEGFTGSWVKKVLGECGNTYNGLNGKTKSDFGHGNAFYVPYVNVYQNAIADVSDATIGANFSSYDGIRKIY